MGVYHWLVTNGLWTGTIYAATGVLVAGLLGLAWTKIKRFHLVRLLEEHVHAQRRIADALDTSTPGGLTDLIEHNKEPK